MGSNSVKTGLELLNTCSKHTLQSSIVSNLQLRTLPKDITYSRPRLWPLHFYFVPPWKAGGATFLLSGKGWR
jgi:hypothetical protein